MRNAGRATAGVRTVGHRTAGHRTVGHRRAGQRKVGKRKAGSRIAGQPNAAQRIPGMRTAGQRSGQSIRCGARRTVSEPVAGASALPDGHRVAGPAGLADSMADATFADVTGAGGSCGTAATAAVDGAGVFLSRSMANFGGVMGLVTTGGTTIDSGRAVD